MHPGPSQDALRDALLPPRLCGEIAGIGGRLKDGPEDFVVEELPAYAASGRGDYLFVTLRKRDLAHSDMLRRLRDVLGIEEEDVGWAGIKDKVAITTQRLSLPAWVEPDLQMLEDENISVLGAERHHQRLKRGHHHGNRFRIVLRDVADGAYETTAAALDALGPVGFPNYYGPQRFGREGENVHRGLGLMRRLANGQRVARRVRQTLAMHAVQSWLFNAVVARRLERELFDVAMKGDVMKKKETGGMFVADDPEVETARVRAGEVIATGPIFGRRMWWPTGDAVELEHEVLELAELDTEIFEAAGKRLAGSRRAIAISPADVMAEDGEPGTLVISFALPRGVYATVLLREIMGDGEA